MDPNYEREISLENALVEAEFLQNANRILVQMYAKMSSKFNEETVSSDDESKSSDQCLSTDSGYSSGKIVHLLVTENETNDKDKANEVPEIELDNDIDVTVSTTAFRSEFTIESGQKLKSKEEQQLDNQVAASAKCDDFDESEATKENRNPANVDRKYTIVHSKFNDFEFVKPHTHPMIPQPGPKSKRKNRKTARVPPATKRSKRTTNATKRALQNDKSTK